MSTTASIPVDLFNPGQVFASLGFLEVAEVLLGDVSGGFDWQTNSEPRFHLRAAGDENPFEVVLRFLATCEVEQFAPIGYSPPPKSVTKKSGQVNQGEAEPDAPSRAEVFSDTFPAGNGDPMQLPMTLCLGGQRLPLEHWTDGSSRDTFKLYAGNRSAFGIATNMLRGKRESKGKSSSGKLISKGVVSLWEDHRAALVNSPFYLLTPMGGSFNFDPRGAWTAIDAGFSPNTTHCGLESSPVVEILSACGLQHARPSTSAARRIIYGIWRERLPPMLARAALSGLSSVLSPKTFRFELYMSGKNKVVTFATEDATS